MGLLPAAGCDANDRAHRVAAAGVADELDTEPMIAASGGIHQQEGLAGILADQHIRKPVVVHVACGQPAAEEPLRQSRSPGGCGIAKTTVGGALKQLHRLGGRNAVQSELGTVQRMSVGHDDIQMAVVVDIEEPQAECAVEPALPRDPGAHGRVGEPFAREVAQQLARLVIEVADEEVGPAVPVVIGASTPIPFMARPKWLYAASCAMPTSENVPSQLLW